MRRLLSDDYADKVIVTTIQKLGLALDENSKRNKAGQEGQATYKDRLEPLRDKRMVFIFDECHRSQFGENHQAIKEFFPNAQLFGFTGTPDLRGERQLPADRRRVRHPSRPRRTSSRSNCTPTPSPTPSRTATSCASTSTTTSPKARSRPSRARRWPSAPSSRPSSTSTTPPPAGASSTPCSPPPPSTTPSSTTRLFKAVQAERQADRPRFRPAEHRLRLLAARRRQHGRAADSGRPAPGKGRQQAGPRDKKKAALKAIIADYNARYGTNHRINDFDLYYQDVQKRIKDQQYPNADLPHKGARRSTSPSSSTCCSPASTPSTSTRSTWTRTSSTTA